MFEVASSLIVLTLAQQKIIVKTKEKFQIIFLTYLNIFEV